MSDQLPEKKWGTEGVTLCAMGCDSPKETIIMLAECQQYVIISDNQYYCTEDCDLCNCASLFFYGPELKPLYFPAWCSISGRCLETSNTAHTKDYIETSLTQNFDQK